MGGVSIMRRGAAWTEAAWTGVCYHYTVPYYIVCNTPNFQTKKKNEFPFSKFWNQQKLLLPIGLCIVSMLNSYAIAMIAC
jgi:hypothetical protein